MSGRVVAADRSELVKLLFPKGGVVAEIGVQRGRFAREIRDACNPELLVLIDCWRFLPGEYERDPANRANEVREEEYRECLEHFGEDPHAIIVRKLSLEAAEDVADNGLDALYIDADHTYPGISADLRAWWPKVRSGGIFAGDDYVEGKSFIDVPRAVDEFVAEHGLDLMVTGGTWPAWAIVKP